MGRVLERAGAVSRLALPVVALSLVLLYVGHQCLVEPSHFEDDRYNLGVVRRSLLPEATHLLETSLVHFYFEPEPIPRAEDWHRTGSLLLLALWARVVGPDETLLRLPHLVWVLAWLVLGWALLRVARDETEEERGPGTRVIVGWSGVALAALLTLGPWSESILRRALVDDVPSGVCALAALLLLARRGVAPRSALVAGTLLGLAFVMKDLYLLWGPLGALVVGLIALLDRRPGTLAAGALAVACFALGFALPAGAKLLWSRVETGRFMPNPSPNLWRAEYYGERPKDGHYPFVLFDDTSYRSRVALAGGPLEVLVKTVRGPVRQLLTALDQLLFAWLWLVPALLAQWRRPTPVRARLLVTLTVATAVYMVVFALGFGEAVHLRYWLVPVTLVLVLGIDGSRQLARDWLATHRDRRGLVVGAGIALLFVALVAARLAVAAQQLLTPEEPPHSAAAMDLLARRLEPGGAALLDLWGGILFWSEHPAHRVVAFPAYHLAALEPARIRRLVDAYGIRVALLSDPGAVAALRAAGFVEVARSSGGEVILERGRSSPSN